MNQFFSLCGKDRPGTAIAYTEGKSPLAHELIPEVKDKSVLPFELVLKKMKVVKSEPQISSDTSDLKYLWLDYQPNRFAWPLMSEKMKVIVDNNLSGMECISWIKAIVKSDSESRIYFIPCFKKQLDVLDNQKTLFVEGTDLVIRPVFSLKKVSNYNLFPCPQLFWEITSDIYVSATLKNVIEKEKLTGVYFENVTTE